MKMQKRKTTNFHSITDLATPDGPESSSESTNSDNLSSSDSPPYRKVKMEPSPTQSLMSISALQNVSHRKPYSLSEWNVSTPSPGNSISSEDSGYGRDYHLTVPYSDDDSNAVLYEDECRAERLRKVRKQRTVFETTQLEMLESTFTSNAYPSSEDYEQLSDKTAIDEARLRIWFQNRRARYRRSSKNIPSTSTPSAPTSGFSSHIASSLRVSPFPRVHPLMFTSHPLLFGRF